jgi:hypothetical protein
MRQGAQRDVLPDRHRGQDTLRLAILGHQREPVADAVGRLRDRHRPTVDENPSAIVTVGAENGADGLRALRSDKAGDPENLAPANVEAHVVKHPVARQLLDAQCFLA